MVADEEREIGAANVLKRPEIIEFRFERSLKQVLRFEIPLNILGVIPHVVLIILVLWLVVTRIQIFLNLWIWIAFILIMLLCVRASRLLIWHAKRLTGRCLERSLLNDVSARLHCRQEDDSGNGQPHPEEDSAREYCWWQLPEYGPLAIDWSYVFRTVAKRCKVFPVIRMRRILGDQLLDKDKSEAKSYPIQFTPIALCNAGKRIRVLNKDRSPEDTKSANLSDKIRILYVLMLLFGIFFVPGVILTITTSDMQYAYGFGALGGLLVVFVLLGIVTHPLRIAGESCFVVPGGFVIRQSKRWSRYWKLNVVSRSDHLMVFGKEGFGYFVWIIDPVGQVIIRRQVREDVMRFILHNWLSPLEPPSEDELEDLR